MRMGANNGIENEQHLVHKAGVHRTLSLSLATAPLSTSS
jgi:hypothetical protein